MWCLCDPTPSRCIDSFQGLTLKSPSSWHRPFAPSPNLYDHVNPATRRTIDQAADDVPSTSDRRLIEVENQVQSLMEAHLSLNPPVQVNIITSSCEICSGPHDTQYCMENPEQAFVDYASSYIDEVGGKWYNFKPEQNNLVFEEKEKVKEGLGGSKLKFKEGESRDIKRNDLNDGMCEETKEKEREESKEEVEEELKEEEDDPKYFDTFPTIEEFDDDDEISNLVDLHMGMLGGGWKWKDLQGLLWWIIVKGSELMGYVDDSEMPMYCGSNGGARHGNFVRVAKDGDDNASN
ncbi:hypothetical protein Tco_0910784 [Tanacetum coccineum]|uniref:MAK10-like protein n=1 Tax=Tanacetum coccineum TaxID=301880 RepID=A0ABQ5D070_9ASTR